MNTLFYDNFLGSHIQDDFEGEGLEAVALALVELALELNPAQIKGQSVNMSLTYRTAEKLTF